MSQENVELTRRFYEAHERRDTAALEALSREHPPSPDFRYESALTGQTYTGPQAVWELSSDIWETLDYVPTVEQILDAGDHVVVMLTISGRGARSGVPVAQPVAVVWTFQDGQLVQGKSYTSREEALAAAGVQR